MKKITLLALVLSFPFFLLAQKSEGEVIYQETIQFRFEETEGASKFAQYLPKEQKSFQKLTFTADESIYTSFEMETNQSYNSESEDGSIRMTIQRPQYTVYKNLAKADQLIQQETFGRKFRIEEQTTQRDWKITGEQKQILNYNCIKAVLQDTSETVIAWFTPQIPVSNGPGTYHKLPGMILELDQDEGRRHLVAQQIDLKAVEEGVIEKPSKGKKMSREEYEVMMEEKTKEMEELNGGSAIRIRMRN